MIRSSLRAITALAVVAVLGMAALLAQNSVAEAQSHSARRSFGAAWAAPGSEFQVAISARDYGAFGQVVETLPDGFTFVRTSLDDFQVEVDGPTLSFYLLDDSRFTYVVTVSATEGQYTFSGIINDSDREGRTIVGNRSLRVGQRPTPTAGHADAGADRHADAGADRHADAGADRHADAGADGHADAGADGHTHAGANAHTRAGANAHTRSDGGTNGVANGGADSNSHPCSPADVESGADIYAGTHCYANADGNPGGNGRGNT